MSGMWRLAGAALCSLLVAITVPNTTLGHGKGVLKLADRRLVAGDTARLAGEKFPKRAELTLLLVGVQGRSRLTAVRTDSAGAFSQVFAIPEDLAFGSYRLVAIAADGDEVGALDVEVGAEPRGHGHETVHDPDASPTSIPLALTRARSPWVTGGALSLIAAALLGSVRLLRRRPPAQQSSSIQSTEVGA